jgi:23S rRNA (adenine2503-C2)-methyltransferase
MPINRRYPVSDLLAACSAYTRKTNRIITFEYSLMRNINDSEQQAHELVRILLPLKCRVNLIRLNPIDEFEAEACPDSTADMFIAILQKAGINTTYRNSRGRGINAACGQLRAQEMQDS